MQQFIILLLAATFLAKIPIINLPLVWFETFFHEISHMLVGIITGGYVKKLVLEWNGSGFCVISDGVRTLIFFAGYIGAPIWGAWLYSIGQDNLNPEIARFRIQLLMGIIIFCTLIWIRDFNSFLIILFMLGILLLLFMQFHESIARQFIRFLGLYVILNAVHSPLYINSAKIPWDDGVAMAELTELPKTLFIGLWHGFAILMLLAIIQIYLLSSDRNYHY